MNAICTNEDCPEYGVVKGAKNFAMSISIKCGGCLEICQRTDLETEPDSAEPAN